jgi:hypothetical protein
MAIDNLCLITNCKAPLSPRSALPICPLCRQTIYRWRARRPAEVLERRRRLTMYSSRMENLK